MDDIDVDRLLVMRINYSFKKMFIFSSVQYKQFGQKYHQGDQFYCRYQQGEKFGCIYKTIFVPLGPCVQSEAGFSNFLDWIDESKYNKAIIELPLILDSSIKEKMREIFKERGYKADEYQKNEGETLITVKGEYKLSKDTAYKVRYANKRTRIEISHSPSLAMLADAYEVYEKSAERIGYTPKSIGAFEVLSPNSILANAYVGDKCVGFIIGHIFEIAVSSDTVSGYKEEKASLCQIVFSGTDDLGRKNKVGYGLRDALIRYSFDTRNVDIVDSLGASEKFGHSYYSFKKEFATHSVSLGGAYSRFKLLP